MTRILARTAAAFSAGAAVIHAAEAPEHFAEWWGYGTFFVAAAAAQILLAVLLLRSPRQEALGGARFGRRPDGRWVIAAGIAGNAGIVVLYGLTRTIGIPLVGPDAGEVEQLTRSGVVATALEILLIGLLVGLGRAAHSSTEPDGVRGRRPPALLTVTHPTAASIRTVAGVALVTFLALVAVEAMPAVIAQQEGGSGPGSALVLGQAIQVASVLIGTAIAAASLSRQPPRAIIVPAFIVLASAIGSLALNDHASMAWIIAAHTLAGLSLGLILTAAFALAAATHAAIRPAAIGLVLIATVGARVAIGIPDRGGLPALAGLSVAALVIAWRIGATTVDASTSDQSRTRNGIAGTPIVGVLVAALGVLATLAGADSSGVAATMLGRPLALNSLDALVAWRSALLVAGLGLFVVGVGAITRHARVERSTLAAAAGVALVSLSAAGATALLVFSEPLSSITPGERAITAVGLAGVAGTTAGVVLGGAWSDGRWRRSRRGLVAPVVMVGATTLAIVAVHAPTNVGTPGLSTLAAAVGIGAGATLTALWLQLSAAGPGGPAIAMAFGVVAAALGSGLGASVARADALAAMTGQTVGPVSGGIVLVIAAVGSLACFELNGLWPSDRNSASANRPSPHAGVRDG